MDLHERISRTAWIVAYCRTLSDIPYSRQIFDEAQKIAKLAVLSAEFENFKKSKDIEIAPTFEARYKLVNRILEENNAIQILEIAVAFFPRGIELTQNPLIAYVGIDLPGSVGNMRIIVKKLIAQGKIPRHANFHLFKGNALDLSDLSAATRPFLKKPIAVVNEGLLRYFYAENTATIFRDKQSLACRQ